MAKKSKRPKPSLKSQRSRHPYEYFSAASDVMVLRKMTGGWHVLLIQRKFPPYQGHWALPGGFIEREEDALTAAKRELQEETGLRCNKLYEFGAFTDPSRDPRGRVVTISYYTIYSSKAGKPKASDDAGQVNWFPIRHLPPLAFDHSEMIQRGWKNFQEKFPH